MELGQAAQRRGETDREFLLDSTPDPGVRVTARESTVEWRAAASGDSILLLLANPSATPQKVSVRWTFEVGNYSGGSTTATINRLKNGAAEVTLGPSEALGLLGEK